MPTRVLVTGGGTGGHLYPALNLAEALRRAEPEVELLYVGGRRGLEARVLPETELPYRLLPAEPLRRARPWRNWRLLATAPAVLWGAHRVFSSFDPDLVVGTGGYASAPLVVGARLRGRPLALQEQNAHPGLVTRAMAPWADQLHLGFPEAAGRLRPGVRTAVLSHGNPVARGEAARPYDWPEGRVVLAAGGSQGARGLNEHLLRDLEGAESWPVDVHLVWVAGRRWAEPLAGRLRERLAGRPWRSRIRVEPYIEDLGAQLSRVSVAIGRAGAMFTAELAAAGVPSVLVPFPGATDAHQRENARAMAGAGAAIVREEDRLRPGELWKTTVALLKDEKRRERMGRAARERGHPDAADRIAADLLRLARERHAPRE